jgi:acyl carrier protein
VNDQDIISELAEILEMDANLLLHGTELVAIDTWDSLATIMFIAMVDEKMGHVLSGDDLQNSKTIGDLISLAKAGIQGSI